jgi:hypothetical protein
MSDPHVEARPSAFRLGRVLLVLLPAAAIVSAGLLGWGYLDLGEQVQRWMLPPLVPVTGRVYLNGEPLGGAELFTQPVGVRCRGGMGVADVEGRFSLRTDVDGDFLDGLYAGQHRVIIHGKDPTVPSGPFKPPLITPPDHAEFDTTPLTVQVDRDPARNEFEFRMEHKPPPRTMPKGPPPKGGPPGGGRPGKSKPADPR